MMKKQYWKRGACAFMAGLMAAGMITGCGGKEESNSGAQIETSEDGVVGDGRYTLDENTPAWQLDTKEDTQLTWYVNADWWNTSWGEDIVTKKIKEDLKIDIEFISGDDTKLNTFFAGGDMPDIISVFDASSSVAQRADSWAYPLQDLADNYDPYFYQVASDQTLSWFAMEDGKTYGYPDYSNTITYVSKTCADPAKAIQIYTYLLSEEGQILTNYGIEGETFQINDDGSYELLPEMKEMQASDNDRFKQEIRIGEFIQFGHDKYKALSNDSFPDSIKQMQEWGEGKLYPHFILENTDPDDGTAEARAYSAIKTNWATTLVGLIRAKDDAEFDSILDEYKDFLENNSWDAITEIKSEKMAANAEKLGE